MDKLKNKQIMRIYKNLSEVDSILFGVFILGRDPSLWIRRPSGAMALL
jgi:hypothetical protein